MKSDLLVIKPKPKAFVVVDDASGWLTVMCFHIFVAKAMPFAP